MNEHRNGRVCDCLVIDVNTQFDFCDPEGAFPVANLGSVIPAMRRVVAWVKRNYAPVVSSIESHRPFELSDSGTPICCVDGSGGQRKVDFTLFPLRATIEVDNTLGMPIDLYKHFQQIIFRKRSHDLLANPKADRLLSYLPVSELIVFGTGMESSIKALALALRARAKSVTVVLDACGYWDRAAADLALRQMVAKGTSVITSRELLLRKLEGRYRRRARWMAESNGNGHLGDSGQGQPVARPAKPRRKGTKKVASKVRRAPSGPAYDVSL
jgi:nicotinamidase-related amidase